jgi:hypothetical protein
MRLESTSSHHNSSYILLSLFIFLQIWDHGQCEAAQDTIWQCYQQS